MHERPAWVRGPQTPRMAGKVALVSGAGSSGPGIGNGRAAAIVLGLHGAAVGVADVDSEAAQETVDLVRGAGGDAVAVGCDAAMDGEVERAVHTVADRFGGIDVLVNNVGVAGPPGDATEVDLGRWDDALRVNVTSMVLTARHCVPLMRERGGGAVVNVASLSGLRGGYPGLLYPTSKGAVVNMTRAMAAQHGAEGIRVNCVAPGKVYTPMMVREGVDEAMREQRRRQSVLGTEGSAWDVALAILYLASDEARWVTGVVLPVDAGASAVQQAGASWPAGAQDSGGRP